MGEAGRGPPGITVSPPTGLETTEKGGAISLTLRLDGMPSDEVTIALGTSHPKEGAVLPDHVTFHRQNWHIPALVTITGLDDLVDDGDVEYTVVTAPAVSLDPTYQDLDADDVRLVNRDDDARGISVVALSGLVTTEAGAQAMFTVHLDSEPTADVTIDLASSEPGEGLVSPTRLVFTAADYGVPRVVTVAGQDDGKDDGDLGYVVLIGAAVSQDPGYAGLDPHDVPFTNLDDDTLGILVSSPSGALTTEAGAGISFSISLGSEPEADVVIHIASNDASEAEVSPGRLVFTAGTWRTEQTVVVKGLDEFVDDGDQSYRVEFAPAESQDLAYDGWAIPAILFENQDDDQAGITVSPPSGLLTHESAYVATLKVRLDSEPTHDVTLALESSDPGEGVADRGSLTFTPLDWNLEKKVVVTGVDDAVADDDQTYTVRTLKAVSEDPLYQERDAADVLFTNIDNDYYLAVTRVSVSSLGTLPNNESELFAAGISFDGRYVVFSSTATNLVASNDLNGDYDVFLHDGKTKTTQRLSWGPSGQEANGRCQRASLSGDARWVAFDSRATNMVSADSNGVGDVFVLDRETKEARRVSVDSVGAQADNASASAVLSADGRFVVFESYATNLVSGHTGGILDVFVHGLESGETTCVSVHSSGKVGDGPSGVASLSADGGVVVFQSAAQNLVDLDQNGVADVFLHDRNTGETTRVSVSSAGLEGDGLSTDASVSADGRYVAFHSEATNLVPLDDNGASDVFVHDRVTRETTRVSVSSQGTEGDGSSAFPSLSADGRYVAFQSDAANLVALDKNLQFDIFVHDRQTGVTTRVSVDRSGLEANQASYRPVFSADGHYIAFMSVSNNLVIPDFNGSKDIYVALRP